MKSYIYSDNAFNQHKKFMIYIYSIPFSKHIFFMFSPFANKNVNSKVLHFLRNTSPYVIDCRLTLALAWQHQFQEFVIPSVSPFYARFSRISVTRQLKWIECEVCSKACEYILYELHIHLVSYWEAIYIFIVTIGLQDVCRRSIFYINSG